MHFSIAREQLLKALKAVSGVVEHKQAQATVLSNALFALIADKLVITASDQDVELTFSVVPQQIYAGGEALLPFKKIWDICRAFPDNSIITIKISAHKATVVAGKSRFVLATLVAEQFPKIAHKEEAVTINIARRVLLELVERTAFAMAEQDVRYFLNGLYFEVNDDQLKAVAADGHRLVMHAVKLTPGAVSATSAISIIVPRKGVLEILRALHDGGDSISLMVSKAHLRLLCGDLELVSSLLEGRFPDYRMVIPRGGDKVVVGDRAVLKDAFARAATLLSEKVRGIILRLKSGHLKISANNTENDEAEDEVEVDYQGEDLEIGFNVRYLIDFLSISSADKIRFTFSNASNSALVEEQYASDVPEVEGRGEAQDLATKERRQYSRELAESGMAQGLYVIMPMRA